MKQKNKSLWCLTALAFLLFCPMTKAAAQTSFEIAQKALNSLVVLELEVEDRGRKRLIPASGFFVQQDWIATCLHVIDGATKGTAKLVKTGQEFHIEGIIASDKKHDLVLLKVSDFGVSTLSLGNSDAVRVGETIQVAGNPQLPLAGKLTLFEGTIIPGIISSTREGDDEFLEFLRDNMGISPNKVIQMSAQLYPGCSGGPVLNEKGEVIGVSFMTLKGEGFFNFAIPANYLKSLLAQDEPVKPLAQGGQSISAFTYFLWGKTGLEQKQYTEAIVDFDEAILLKPNFADVYYNRGIAKYKLGQHESALTDFDETIRLKPNFADAYHNRGIARVSLGFYHSGIADFDEAVQINQVSGIADFDEAVQINPMDMAYDTSVLADYDQAIRLKPDFVKAYRNRESRLLSLGNYDAMFEDFNGSREISARSVADSKLTFKSNHNWDWDSPLEIRIREAYFNRGIAKQLLGQHEAAIVDFDKVIQLNAGAVWQLQMKREAGEHRMLDTAIQMIVSPPNVDAAFILLHQGLSKIMLDRLDEAKVDFQTALELAVKYRSRDLEVILNQLLETNDNNTLKIAAKRLLEGLNQ